MEGAVRIFMAAFALLAASQAHAEAVYAPWMPPGVYHHAYEGPGELRTINLPMTFIRAVCQAKPNQIRYACAFRNKSGCLIIMPDHGILGGTYYRALWYHERGHCNGWPRHHPRGLVQKVK